MPKNVRSIARAAVIAALYALLTIFTQPISYGPIQFRVSEALGILPLFFPESVIGLTVGCLIANLIGLGIFDIVFGTFATFLAAITTYFVGKLIKNTAIKLVLGELSPCVFNGLIIPLVILLAGIESEGYLIDAASIFLSEAVCLGVIGTALYFALLPLMKFLKPSVNENGNAEETDN